MLNIWYYILYIEFDIVFFIYLCYHYNNKSFRGGVFIRPTIRELEEGIRKAGSIVVSGFVFPRGKKMKAKGGEFIEKGGDSYLLLNGCSFGGGTPTVRIIT